MELEHFVVGEGRFITLKYIGKGGSSEVVLARDTKENEQVAIKLEKKEIKKPLLAKEFMIYRILNGGPGIVNVSYYFKEKKYNAMVMDVLDNTMERWFQEGGKKFSLKTICMIALQNIETIKFIHSKGYIHCDIKPENFMTGLQDFKNQIYLIDYGIAVSYLDSKGKHKPFKQNNKNIRGTVRYASINLHMGNELSRRDDMETLGYTFCYYARGNLPWQGVKAPTVRQKFVDVAAVKQKTSLKTLCKGLPEEFFTYIKYARELEFEATPDYKYCAELFSGLMNTHNYVYDDQFDWLVTKR